MLKTKISFILLVFGLASCQVQSNQHEETSQATIEEEINQKENDKTPIIELNHWPIKMPQIDYNQFKINEVKNFNVGLATRHKDSCAATSDSLNKYLYLHNYFTKLEFNSNFKIPVFISVEEANMLILGTVDPKGKLLGNLVLANESSWENGNFEVFSQIESDSIVHRTSISREHDQDEKRYLQTWSTITIKELFHISSSGHIFLINRETIEDMNHNAPVNTLIKEQQNNAKTLPTPDATFFIGLDSLDVDGILEKYMKYYNIENKYTDNIDGSYTYEIKKYKLEEVESILKILLTVNDGQENGWNDTGYDYQGMCNLEIYEINSTIIIDFGCSC